jgi:hypothetical protein
MRGIVHFAHSKLFSRSSVAKSLHLALILTSFFSYRIQAFNTSGSLNRKMDAEYPGTAVERMLNIRDRVRSLSVENLSEDWATVRRRLLWAGGLKDLENAIPGQGYTGHSFNDFNHCDLTAMRADYSSNENQGRVDGIAFKNQLGPGIILASLEELGEGGSWSTCMMGCNRDPPQDVAHLQFHSRIAFKLVWCPPDFNTFVLVDDDGNLLNQGTPQGRLPDLNERRQNYRLVAGSKYAVAADSLRQASHSTHSNELK